MTKNQCIHSSMLAYSGTTPTGATKNSRAVAEFQGQTMNPSDLTEFFRKYVKNYNAGKDDVVSKFVGDRNLPHGGVEISFL